MLIDYLRELNVNVDELCRDFPANGFRCPPGEGDDFRSRFFIVSYMYLKVLNWELRELASTGVIVEGISELISDVITDMRLYNAPPELMNAVASIARDILHVYRGWGEFIVYFRLRHPLVSSAAPLVHLVHWSKA